MIILVTLFFINRLTINIFMKAKIEQKQIQLNRKLSTIKDVFELKKIYNSVEQQNNVLRQDILSLKYKVDILMQKQKSRPHQTRDDQVKAAELQSTQKELKFQYRLMQQLKKRLQTSKAGSGTEQINSQILRIENEMKNVQQELVLSRQHVSDFKNETTRLQTTLAVHQEEIIRNQPKIQQFSQENKELRKKILSVQKLRAEKQYQSVKVMNSMYTIKTRYSKNEELFNQIQKQKLSTLKEKKLTKDELLNLPELEREVQQLKRVVRQKEKEHIHSEAANLRLKEKMMEKNKDLVRQSKQLEDKRSRAINQLNKFKKAWQKYIQMQNNNKNLKQYIETQAQSEEFVPPQTLLRRDFAGILGGKNQFDDRMVLKNNTKSFITGFFIYELDHASSAKNLLVAIRAIYDDAEASAANQVPIPGQYLAKCKVSKYVLVEGDFVKLLKVKFNSNQNRILKVQIRTNRNTRYQFGDKRHFSDLVQGENVYGFDISVQEYPVSLFGSYNTIRSQWYMESLGAEINDLDHA